MAEPTDRQHFRETLARLATKTETKIPALNGRVAKAVKLVLAADVRLHEDGSATVYSSTDPTRRYELKEGTCVCRDWQQAPEHLCQHRLAAGLLRRVQELLPTTTKEPPVSAAAEHSTPMQPAVPLPEAPASVNVRLTIAGREVQWTLRDHDEARLAVRLDALLQHYHVPASPPVRHQDTATAPQCPTHGALKPSTRGKGWYCAHKLEDGTWCPSKGT